MISSALYLTRLILVFMYFFFRGEGELTFLPCCEYC